MAQTVVVTRTFDIDYNGTTGELKAEIDAVVARQAVGTDSIVKSIQGDESGITLVVQKPDNP
jgi:hypothetical protein